MRRLGAAIFILLGAAPFAAGAAHAATFTVNSELDATDGTCGPAPAGCTLREAIEAAVATPGRDAIAFDPGVFPPAGVAPLITLQTPLPVIADPAGTVIDGKGATVTVNGGGQQRALVFESAAGVPLEKVTVANLLVINVTGNAIEVCGGVSLACVEDVTGVLFEHVAIGGVGSGIVVRGGVISKLRVVGALISNHQANGILVVAERTLLGARVEGTSVLGGTSGIDLVGFERVVGATVVDSVASRCSHSGIVIQGQDLIGTKVNEVVTTLNSVAGGIRILADGVTTKTTVTNAVTSASGANGVEVFGTVGNSAMTIRNVTAEGSSENGVRVFGPTDGATFAKLVMTGNPTGLRLTETGAGFMHAQLSDVVSADNMGGIVLVGGANTLKKIHVAANFNSGMLLSGSGGNVVEKSRALGNGSVGIGTDSDFNTIRKNVALGNKRDLSDDHPTCAANVWQKNVFRSGSAPCIH
ncbi:MAG: right-handed parallel beta-helix repeat-containing protein [Candidatus Binatia bacterium]